MELDSVYFVEVFGEFIILLANRFSENYAVARWVWLYQMYSVDVFKSVFYRGIKILVTTCSMFYQIEKRAKTPKKTIVSVRSRPKWAVKEPKRLLIKIRRLVDNGFGSFAAASLSSLFITQKLVLSNYFKTHSILVTMLFF